MAFSSVIFVTTPFSGVSVPTNRVIYRRNLGLLVTGTLTSKGMTLFEIGVKIKPGKRYVYVDYEPPEDIRLRRPATYKEIRERIKQEYGLKAIPRYIAQVKRKHGILKDERLPEDAEHPRVPAEIESAVEAALKHFRMI